MSKSRSIMTLALVALCVTLASGAAFADSWARSAATLPTTMLWDAASAGSVTALNDGATTWDDAYALVSVEGSTVTAIAVDRWGLAAVPIPAEATVAPEASRAFSLALVAPPISGVFQCAWVMADGDDNLILTDIATSDVTIRRFAEIVPGREGAWAAEAIEACAGRVPFIVQGFDAVTYGPSLNVTRAQMAVFIARAMMLELDPPEDPTFPDVGAAYWAFAEIEAVADAGVADGYGDGSFQPEWNIIRGQMASFIARAAGIEGEYDDAFEDVLATYPHADDIQACVDEGIVLGYDDGLYRPSATVTRDQLAVFCYRAFIRDEVVPVVVGGPGLTNVNVDAAAYVGWSTALEDPGYAYVVFNPDNLDGSLADGGTWDITFEFRSDVSPTETVTASFTAAEIDDGDAEIVAVAVPALDAGDWTLAVLVEDAELRRTVAFTVSEE